MQEIEKIKQTGKFTWGQPVEWFEIGPYTLLAFHPRERVGYRLLDGVYDSDVTNYHGWVDGEDTNESWPTLETALAGVMGLNWAGNNNGGVGYYFCKMIDAPPYDKK